MVSTRGREQRQGVLLKHCSRVRRKAGLNRGESRTGITFLATVEPFFAGFWTVPSRIIHELGTSMKTSKVSKVGRP